MASQSAEFLQQVARLRALKRAKIKEPPKKRGRGRPWEDKRRKRKRTKYRPDAKYVTRGGQEYFIRQVFGGFEIKKYLGGKIPRQLSGTYQTYPRAEKAVVDWIKAGDFPGTMKQGIYPGWEDEERDHKGYPVLEWPEQQLRKHTVR